MNFVNFCAKTFATHNIHGNHPVGIIAAPLLIVFFAPGFLWEGKQCQIAVTMLRITFPYLLFIPLSALAGTNAHDQFAAPAITPVFLDICMIMAAVWLSPLSSESIQVLAWSVFAVGVVQLLFQLPALFRLGLLPRLRWGRPCNHFVGISQRRVVINGVVEAENLSIRQAFVGGIHFG